MAVKHLNNGKCPMCAAIFDRYPDFYPPLRRWFEAFQEANPEGHISCAGRGRLDQEALFQRKATRARYGKSAHNFNAAFDLFENGGERSDIYEKNWFQTVVATALPSWLNWYGFPGSSFYELPHVEVHAWREMAADGRLKLVEK